MRILVVTSQFPIAGEPTRGRAVYQTVRALAELADVEVVCPVAMYPRWARPGSYMFRDPGVEFQPEGVSTRYVTYAALPAVSRPLNGWSSSRPIGAALRESQPDVILAYWLYPDAYGALLAARECGVPVVAGARGSDIRVRDAISQRQTRRVVAEATRLLVVSDDLGRLAVQKYGAQPHKVRVVSNGCDIRLFRVQDRAQARAALRVDTQRELVVYVGRLVIEKGLRELIAASLKLRARRPGIEVVLVGDGPARAELAQLAASAPVRFAGVQSPQQVAEWIAAANVVTLPSYSEGYPNVLVEALACGRPVVASGVGGVLEIIDDACGVTVQPRDAVGLERGLDEALRRSWDEQVLAARFSRSWDQVARETMAVCQEAASEARPTACAEASV